MRRKEDHLKNAMKALNDCAWMAAEEKVPYLVLAVGDLTFALREHLESQKSPETPGSEASSPATASPTTDSLSDALASPIEAMTELSRRLHGVLTEQERSDVANDYLLSGLWSQLVSSLATRARVARGTSWTSLRQELKQSAAPESSVTSPSDGSDCCGHCQLEWCIPCPHCPLHFHGKNRWHAIAWMHDETGRTLGASLSSSSASAGGESERIAEIENFVASIRDDTYYQDMHPYRIRARKLLPLSPSPSSSQEEETR